MEPNRFAPDDKDEAAFIKAASDGNLEEVTRLISEGVNINAINKLNKTALFKAASKGHKEIVEALLKAGANPNIFDTYGYTTLMAGLQHKEIVQLLLKNGVDPNVHEEDNDTALILASMDGNQEMIDILLKGGADPNIKGEGGSTALIQAYFNSKEKDEKIILSIVTSLLAGGANPDIQDDNGLTVMVYAALNGHKDVVNELLTSGANPNIQSASNDTYALYGACLYDHIEVVKVLLNQPTIKNLKLIRLKMNLLDLAKEGFFSSIINELLIQKFEGKEENQVNANTAIIQAIRNDGDNYIESLSEADRFLLSEYTRHGDVIINALLLGNDTIKTYDDNIYNAIKKDEEYGIETTFNKHCLILLEIYPRALELKKEGKFNKEYTNVIYPIIRKELDKNNIEYFRTRTYNVIKKLNAILMKHKFFDKVITVYRGVKEKYLPTDSTIVSKLIGFTSTSLNKIIAINFSSRRDTGTVYIFKLHPKCAYVYLESVSKAQGEQEILLSPGNRYTFLSETGITQTYAVLPPEPGYELPATYTEYVKYLKTVQRMNNLLEENRAAYTVATAVRGGTRKKRNHK